jgi:CheY-like chemotaxis protein
MVELSTLDVLIVDDHEAMRAMLRKVLDRAGVQSIRDAANGADAIALLEQSSADLILADLTMPGMDGLAFARRVRGEPRWARARIVMLTGRGDAATAEAAQQAGIDLLLTKPVAPRDLLAAINRVLAD